MNDKPVVTIYKYHHISSAHKLDLPYESKCTRVHGHNYKFEMWLTGVLDEYGMVLDFHDLKREVNKLDHVNLSEMFDWQTTAENISVYMAEQLMSLAPDRLNKVKVRVWETETAWGEHTVEA